jgi:hypothetical protein
VLASLGGIKLLAWLYLLGMTRDMNAMSDMPGKNLAHSASFHSREKIAPSDLAPGDVPDLS